MRNKATEELKNSEEMPKKCGGGVYYKAKITIIPIDKTDILVTSNDDGETDPFAEMGK